MFHPTKNDLSDECRQTAVDLLNQQLSNLIDLGAQAKQAHWNVRGPHFIGLHELFDDVHSDVREAVDEVAERVAALGGVAIGTVQQVSKFTHLPEYPLNAISGRHHVDALSTALARTAASARTSIDQLEECGDTVSADLMTGITAELDKKTWFVEAHLHSDH